MTTQLLLLATLLTPLIILIAGAAAPLRSQLPRILWLAPSPALLLAFFGEQGTSIAFGTFQFKLDTTGTILLTAAAALWIVGGAAVPSYFSKKLPNFAFTACWLFTLTGSLGVFLAQDLIGFLVFYAMVSLPAYGLVIHDGTPEARRAGKIYLGFALLGENLLLPAFVLLFNGYSAASPAVLILLLAGFGAKMALLPLHFWMPPSYTAAPIPAAAVLSGAAVKAGVIGLLRFLPLDIPLPAWGETLTIIGFCGAFYGVAVGMTQRNPKTVLAYSSISQMGFLAALIGMGLTLGDAEIVPLAGYYASHHMLAKGALFLALGSCAVRPLFSIAPAALISLGLAGLPLTGGALAKLAVKSPFGYGIAASLASLSAAGTAMLMTHFLFRMADARKASSSQSSSTLIPWLAAAAMSLMFPWTTYAIAGLTLEKILAPDALWKTLWPVVLGVIAALLMRKKRLLEIPSGDILSLANKVLPSTRLLADKIAQIEGATRHWAVACILILVLVLGFSLLFAIQTSAG